MGAGLTVTPLQGEDLLRTKFLFGPIFGGWTQSSNLLDGLEDAEILQFWGRCQIRIALIDVAFITS